MIDMYEWYILSMIWLIWLIDRYDVKEWWIFLYCWIDTSKRKRHNIETSDDSDGDVSDSSEVWEGPREVETKRVFKRCDAMIKKAVMEEIFMDLDFKCSSACMYGGKCRNQPGFIDFIRELRTSFWGARGSKPMSNERRRDVIRNIRELGNTFCNLTLTTLPCCSIQTTG